MNGGNTAVRRRPLKRSSIGYIHQDKKETIKPKKSIEEILLEKFHPKSFAHKVLEIRRGKHPVDALGKLVATIYLSSSAKSSTTSPLTDKVKQKYEKSVTYFTKSELYAYRNGCFYIKKNTDLFNVIKSKFFNSYQKFKGQIYEKVSQKEMREQIRELKKASHLKQYKKQARETLDEIAELGVRIGKLSDNKEYVNYSSWRTSNRTSKSGLFDPYFPPKLKVNYK
jgi:ABC-type dipeptide/oligopeptide/nickel transport system ATPase subunit